MSKASGLFDEQIRLEKLSKKQDPLEHVNTNIDFMEVGLPKNDSW